MILSFKYNYIKKYLIKEKYKKNMINFYNLIIMN